MPFIFKKLEIPGVVLIEPKVFKDERGFFMEMILYFLGMVIDSARFIRALFFKSFKYT